MGVGWDDIEAPIDPPFALEELDGRLVKVRAAMAAAGIDLLLASSPENIYYLTGYRTTGYYVYQIFLLPREGEGWFVTSKLEHTNVLGLSRATNGLTVGMTDSNLEVTIRAAEKAGAGDAAHIGYEERGFWIPPEILDGLRTRFTRAAFAPAGFILEGARAVKSPAEVACIREAARIASLGMRAGLDAVAPGVTENAIAGTVHKALGDAGGEYPAGQPYVVTGWRGALAHMTAERHRVAPGECVYFEVGGCYKRYGGSVMRMASVGPPSVEARSMADATLAALEATIAAIRPGVASRNVDRAGRGAIERAGYGDCFRHRLGYSMGIAFPPGWGEGLVMDIAEGNERPLEPGMVFHCVPMIGVPGFGCMGFSETILVTPEGNEVLTDVPRELVVR
jgi:Xaa-Pro dipeptidase